MARPVRYDSLKAPVDRRGFRSLRHIVDELVFGGIGVLAALTAFVATPGLASSVEQPELAAVADLSVFTSWNTSPGSRARVLVVTGPARADMVREAEEHRHALAACSVFLDTPGTVRLKLVINEEGRWVENGGGDEWFIEE